MIYCKKCGARMKMRPNEVTASIPPKRIYDCPRCGNVQYSTQYDDERVRAVPSPVIKHLGKVTINSDINLDKYDWPNFRRKMAVVAFKRLMSMEVLGDPEKVASKAVEYADELTKKLKEGGKLLTGNAVQSPAHGITLDLSAIKESHS